MGLLLVAGILAIVLLFGGAAVYNYLESLPPDVKFVSFSTEPLNIVEGDTMRIDVDVKNSEDEPLSNILIKTEFDGAVKYATIRNPVITIPELNANQNTGIKTIDISTRQIADDGEITYSGKVTVEVMNANQTSDERSFELTISPRK